MNTRILSLALLMLFAMSAIYAQACPQAQRSIFVPAVVSGQEGGLLRVMVKTTPGNGSVFTSIAPLVGVSTQISEQTAIGVAFASAGYKQKECDVHINFLDMGPTQSVDGPSAGLAMAIATKSAIENTTLRQDIVITGAIDNYAQAGAVGGIIDKAQASARNGKKILITPKQQIYENILISKLGRENDFSALEVQTLDEAYKIATSKEGEKFAPNFKLEQTQIPSNLVQRNLNDDDLRLAKVSQEINGELLAKINSNGQWEMPEYKEHFRIEAKLNEQISQKGYAYTAANNAFLSQIDAAFLSTPPQNLDLEAEIEKTKECTASLEVVGVTDKNFEWVSGSRARKEWANKKIGDIQNASEGYGSQEEKYLQLREIYYARSWCQASKYMAAQAKEIGGKMINESDFENIARASVKQAEQMIEKSLVPSQDAQWHLQISQESLKSKNYPAAIYDAAYAQGVQVAANHEAEQDEEYLLNTTNELLEQNFGTLWGRAYQSQGMYGTAQAREKNASITSSYSVLVLSASMEDSMLEAKKIISNPPISVQVKDKEAKKESTFEQITIELFVAVCLLSLCVEAVRQAGRKN